MLDIVPEELRRVRGWPSVVQALHDMHFPATVLGAERGRQRLMYEEFLVLQVALALRRRPTPALAAVAVEAVAAVVWILAVNGSGVGCAIG